MAEKERRERRAEALERRSVDARLRTSLDEARAALEAGQDPPRVHGEHDIDTLLQLPPGQDLAWVEGPAGYLFRYWGPDGVVRFTLSWSGLHEVCEGRAETIEVEPE